MLFLKCVVCFVAVVSRFSLVVFILVFIVLSIHDLAGPAVPKCVLFDLDHSWGYVIVRWFVFESIVIFIWFMGRGSYIFDLYPDIFEMCCVFRGYCISLIASSIHPYADNHRWNVQLCMFHCCCIVLLASV